MSKQKVIIVGAGLAGSLLAIYLAKKGIKVEVYESRADMRKEKTAMGRSINLALSNRGIAALKEVGLDQYMLAEAVPMLGRMIHSADKTTKFLPYSGREGEFINSVSRAGLNIALINEAEKYEGVKFYFNHQCIGPSQNAKTLMILNVKNGKDKSITGDTVIATDGAGSSIRNSMMSGGLTRFNFSQNWLEHGYKELHIPPGKNDEFQMEKNALHIWARGSFMMIALPNSDMSFTCTLFLAHKGENSFEELKSEQDVLKFFRTYFADALPLMPTLTEDFFNNVTGNLGTIKCFPWNVRGEILLLGDAAHAVVPFYGQGMNCAFEDCRILNQLIDQHGTAAWETVFNEYANLRKDNTDAIADMAEENFYEMRDAVANPVFQKKRELETRLEQTFPDYFSKYSMVTFREDLPYLIAKQKGNAQDKYLMDICAGGIEDISQIDLPQLLDKLKML